MKKIFLLPALLISLIFGACEGPVGPPGYDGIDGLDGVNILGKVYDITDDFSASNDYTIFSVFAQDAPSVEVFETDVVLVYILWDQVDSSSGPVDIWRLLPQTRLLNQGILQYNYDFTYQDVTIFLESDFSLSTLLPGDTNNQTFRIAILPADGVGKSNLDVSNMEEVLKFLGVENNQVPKVYLNN
jgi:hypothetical protein